NDTHCTPDVCPWRVAVSCLVVASHSRTVWSSEPLARVRPSGLYATEQTLFVCPWSLAMASPVATSHSHTIRSSEPEALASVVPSGLRATEATSDCKRRVALGCPVLTSHNRTVLSREALARVVPSGLNATAFTISPCTWRVTRDWPVLTS